MSHVFVDCGASNGSMTEWYISQIQFPLNELRCYLVEPNPLHQPALKKLREKYKLSVIPKIAWVENTKMPFLAYEDWRGAGVYQQSTAGKIQATITIDAFDFSAWVHGIIGPDDRAVLKMDIEGAEFKILPRMIKDRTLLLFKECLIEEHTRLRPDEFTPVWNEVLLFFRAHPEIKLTLLPN